MRAQNESPPVVVRHVRGQSPDGSATDIPNAYEVARVDEKALANGDIWPQSRGSQLAGLCVGSLPGERVLDLCAAPGGKATMLAGDVVAVELSEARARELEENVRRLGADEVHGRARGRARAPARADRVRPGARRRAVLGPRCPGGAARSPVAVEPAAGSAAGTAARRRGAGAAGRHDRLLRLHRQRGRVRGGGRRIGTRDRGDRGMGAVPSRRRPEFLQTMPHLHRTSGFFIARLRVGSS